MGPEPGEKIRIVYAPGVNPEFGTVEELRDALLESYPGADYFGGPFVGCNRDDVMPAWGWVVRLVRMRSDWWPAIGIALQHAATDGGELARTAMADLLAGYRDSIALAPWTEQAAQQWPDVKATGSGTGWGAPDLRLETIIRDRQRFLEQLEAASGEVFLMGHGKAGKAISGPLTNEAELCALLDESARAGQFPDGDKGPWSWLGFELLTRGEWLRAAFSRAVLAIDAAAEASPREGSGSGRWRSAETASPREGSGSGRWRSAETASPREGSGSGRWRSAETASPPTASVFALLDWFSEERDLWRFEPLLAEWYANPPTWAQTAANRKPKGWRRTIRSSHWPEVETLGDVARQALWRAQKQLATAPIIDLPQLYGSRPA
jgi:hypothetical protein